MTKKTTGKSTTRKSTTRKTTRRTAPAKRTVVSPFTIPAVKAAESGNLTKPQVISELTKSPHGDLSEYLPVGLRAAKEDPDFFAHLVAWNHRQGQVRDAKIALPVISLLTTNDPVYRDNACAHLADLEPKSFLRALDFLRQTKAPSRLTRRLVKRYLRDYEAEYGSWERAAVQHRKYLHEMYARFSVKPAAFADEALFKGGDKGKLGVIRKLASMDPIEAAGHVLKHKIPFLVAKGALGKKLQDPDVLVAVINSMTPSEVVTNTKALEKLGIKTIPAARSAFEQAIKRAAESKKAASTLKTSVAAAAIDDEALAGKLRNLQEKQLDNLKGIEGNWLVLGDCSPSMEAAIEKAKEVAGVLARLVKGNVYLVFFAGSPRFFDVTGKTLEDIKKITRGVGVAGSTSIGCGIQLMADKGLHVDGIAVISDGEENSPPFAVQAYQNYVRKMGAEPTVYFYHLKGSGQPFLQNMKAAQIDVQTFELAKQKVDYYSLPNLVQTMRVGRYSLLDEVYNVSFKTLNQVLTNTTNMEVIGHVSIGHTQAV